MSDERRRVLDLLAQGRITVDEADELLKTLGANAAREAAGAPPAGDAASDNPQRTRWVRINVHRTNDDRGEKDEGCETGNRPHGAVYVTAAPCARRRLFGSLRIPMLSVLHRAHYHHHGHRGRGTLVAHDRPHVPPPSALPDTARRRGGCALARRPQCLRWRRAAPRGDGHRLGRPARGSRLRG